MWLWISFRWRNKEQKKRRNRIFQTMKKICKFILLKIIQSCTRYYNTCYFQRKKWKKNCCGRKWAESGIKVVCSENRNCIDYSISLKVTWYFLGSICSSKFENSFIKKMEKTCRQFTRISCGLNTKIWYFVVLSASSVVPFSWILNVMDNYFILITDSLEKHIV